MVKMKTCTKQKGQFKANSFSGLEPAESKQLPNNISVWREFLSNSMQERYYIDINTSICFQAEHFTLAVFHYYHVTFPKQKQAMINVLSIKS